MTVNTCGSYGSYAILLVDEADTSTYVPVTFDSNSERYQILSESIRYVDNTLGGAGMTGTIDKIFNHLRPGARLVTGRIVMEVGPVQLTAWLPRILGNAASVNTFATDTTFDNPPFDIFIRRDKADHYYRHCAVNRCLLQTRAGIGSQEQTMRMTLDILGYEEHTDQSWPGTPPPLTTSQELYWVHGDGKFTADTNNPSAFEEYYFDAFNLLIDNNLVPQTRNFLNVTCLQSRGRSIRLQMPIPLTATNNTNFYANRYEGAILIEFLGTKNMAAAYSAYDTTFSMPNVRQVLRTPTTAGRGEIPLSLDFEAYRESTDEPLTITNASA